MIYNRRKSKRTITLSNTINKNVLTKDNNLKIFSTLEKNTSDSNKMHLLKFRQNNIKEFEGTIKDNNYENSIDLVNALSERNRNPTNISDNKIFTKENENKILIKNPKDNKSKNNKDLERKESYYNEIKTLNEVKLKNVNSTRRKQYLFKFLYFINSNILNLLSIIIYITQTIFEIEDTKIAIIILEYLQIFEIILCYLFLGEYILFLINTKSRLKFIFSIDSLIDFITILPPIISYHIKAFSFKIQFIRIIRIFRVFRILRIYKTIKRLQKENNAEEEDEENSMKINPIKLQLFVILLILFCNFFIFSGLILGLNSIFENAFSLNNQNFFDAFYFTIISASTVGYGEIIPTNTFTRIFLVFAFFTLILFVSNEVAKISLILQTWGPESLSVNYKDHIILALDNSISYLLVIKNLQKKFPHKKFVIISKDELNFNSTLIKRKRIKFIKVKEYEIEAFYRSNAKFAYAIMIFCEKSVSKCETKEKIVDYLILKINRYYQDIPMYLQTLNSERNSFALGKIRTNIKNVTPVLRIKTLINSKCLFNPGFACFVQNLIFNDTDLPMDFDTYNPLMQNYFCGMQNKIITYEFPSYFFNIKFSEAMFLIYFKSIEDYFMKIETLNYKVNRGILLIGIVEITRYRLSEKEDIRIFPDKYIIKPKTKGVFISYNDNDGKYIENFFERFFKSDSGNNSFVDNDKNWFNKSQKSEIRNKSELNCNGNSNSNDAKDNFINIKCSAVYDIEITSDKKDNKNKKNIKLLNSKKLNFHKNKPINRYDNYNKKNHLTNFINKNHKNFNSPNKTKKRKISFGIQNSLKTNSTTNSKNTKNSKINFKEEFELQKNSKENLLIRRISIKEKNQFKKFEIGKRKLSSINFVDDFLKKYGKESPANLEKNLLDSINSTKKNSLKKQNSIVFRRDREKSFQTKRLNDGITGKLNVLMKEKKNSLKNSENNFRLNMENEIKELKEDEDEDDDDDDEISEFIGFDFNNKNNFIEQNDNGLSDRYIKKYSVKENVKKRSLKFFNKNENENKNKILKLNANTFSNNFIDDIDNDNLDKFKVKYSKFKKTKIFDKNSSSSNEINVHSKLSSDESENDISDSDLRRNKNITPKTNFSSLNNLRKNFSSFKFQEDNKNKKELYQENKNKNKSFTDVDNTKINDSFYIDTSEELSSENLNNFQSKFTNEIKINTQNNNNNNNNNNKANPIPNFLKNLEKKYSIKEINILIKKIYKEDSNDKNKTSNSNINKSIENTNNELIETINNTFEINNNQNEKKFTEKKQKNDKNNNNDLIKEKSKGSIFYNTPLIKKQFSSNFNLNNSQDNFTNQKNNSFEKNNNYNTYITTSSDSSNSSIFITNENQKKLSKIKKSNIFNKKNFKNPNTNKNFKFFEKFEEVSGEILCEEISKKCKKHYSQLEKLGNYQNFYEGEFNIDHKIFELDKFNTSEIFTNHILIIGYQDDLDKFIRLISYHFEDKIICILGSEEKKDIISNKILTQYKNVYFLLGNATNPFDLLNAGLNNAFYVVFLCEKIYPKLNEDLNLILSSKLVDYYFDLDSLMELWDYKSNNLLGYIPYYGENNKQDISNEFLHPLFMSGKLLYLSHLDKLTSLSLTDPKIIEALNKLISVGFRKTVNVNNYKNNNNKKLILKKNIDTDIPVIITIDLPEYYYGQEYHSLVHDLIGLKKPALPIGLYISDPLVYQMYESKGKVIVKNEKEFFIQNSHKRKLVNNHSMGKVESRFFENMDILKEWSFTDKVVLNYVDLKKSHLPIFVTNPLPGFVLNKGTKVMLITNYTSEMKGLNEFQDNYLSKIRNISDNKAQKDLQKNSNRVIRECQERYMSYVGVLNKKFNVEFYEAMKKTKKSDNFDI